MRDAERDEGCPDRHEEQHEARRAHAILELASIEEEELARVALVPGHRGEPPTHAPQAPRDGESPRDPEQRWIAEHVVPMSIIIGASARTTTALDTRCCLDVLSKKVFVRFHRPSQSRVCRWRLVCWFIAFSLPLARASKARHEAHVAVWASSWPDRGAPASNAPCSLISMLTSKSSQRSMSGLSERWRAEREIPSDLFSGWQNTPAMLTRPIPRTGEALPSIGLGTWQTFDVGTTRAAREPLVEVLRRFLAAGASVIDSSPMYGNAERATGDLLAELGEGLGDAGGRRPFLATKVWTRGRAQGIEEMNRSFERMRTERMDLMQIHNLLDWQTHLPVLRDWKSQGRIRYIGITHYAHSAFPEMEKILRSEAVDFVQLPYNVADREAEKRLLPAALDTGTAVLVMRPFDEGALLRRLHAEPLPAWAKTELDCSSWSALLLKFILGHPAVTCPIPATSSPAHLDDNLRAGNGRIPDESTRKRIVQAARL
jgi:aryl-alcohol dehydrogenase-like predicted oxidoreductase